LKRRSKVREAVQGRPRLVRRVTERQLLSDEERVLAICDRILKGLELLRERGAVDSGEFRVRRLEER